MLLEHRSYGDTQTSLFPGLIMDFFFSDSDSDGLDRLNKISFYGSPGFLSI